MGHDEKSPYAKINMEKYMKKLVDGYDKFTEILSKFRKPCRYWYYSKQGKLEEPMYIYQHRLFVG